MITIVDYGMGNLGSVFNMFKKIGVASKITSNIEEIKSASKLLLPGVGSFDMAMQKINDSGIKEVLDQKVLIEETPILGICLGMQLLTNSSEEGHEKGLGYINAHTKKFIFQDKKMKVPHMGWNITTKSTNSKLTEDFTNQSRFYFVHSYYLDECDTDLILANSHNGFEFPCAVGSKNVMGVQFHPEKSHRFGRKFLKDYFDA